MIKYIVNALNIDDLPRWLLSHLFLMGVFLGAFNALFFISAFSSFLAQHDLTFYPEIIAGSGIFGVLLFNLYKFMFKKYVPKKAVLIFFGIFAIIIILVEFLPLLFTFFSRPFMLLGVWMPVTIISEFIFFKIIQNVPIIKEHQNLKRFMEFGMILGNVFMSIIIVILSTLQLKVPFTLISLSCLLFVIIDYYYLSKQLEYNDEMKEEESVDSLISLLSEIPLKRTVFTVVIFAMLSILTFVFVEYTFLSALDKIYTDKLHLIQFMAFFLAAIMIVNLLFKLFVYQNLIKSFQINKALQLSPFFMVLMLLIINALLLMPPYNNISSPYSIVFLSIVFSRFFSYLLRESFELFSLKLFFSAIETYTHRLLSGFLNQLLNFWSFIFAGLLLLLFNSLEIKSLSGILVVNVGFAFLWLLVSMEMSKNYTVTISNMIKKLTMEFRHDDVGKAKSLKDRIMVTTNLSGMRYLLNYQRNYQPNIMQKTSDLIQGNEKSESGSIEREFNLNQKLSNDYDHESIHVNSFSFYDSDENLTINDIEPLAVSVKIKDRIRSVKMIENARNPKYYGILKMLLRDPDDEVKRNAISCASIYYNSSIISELLEYIENEDFSDLVTDALVLIGNDAIESLANLFHKSDLDTKTLMRVIRTIGRISTESAQRFLFERLIYPNKWIVLEVVNSLNEQKFKFGFNDYSLIDKAIRNTCGAAAWLLAMDVSLPDFAKQSPIKRALDEEYQVTIDLLFKLLQLKYSDGVIQEVRKYLMSDSANEQRELSVEMLGIILDKQIKEYLFPLLHNNRKQEKVSQLQAFFPIEEKEPLTALREIINSDLGYVSLWTKACALNAFIDRQDISLSEDVYAQVFNPDPLLSEIAYFGIYKWRKEVSQELFSRLSNKMKKRLKIILDKGEHFEYQILFNKVLSLQNISYFEKVKGHYLIPLAGILAEHYMDQGESMFIQCSDEEVLPVFMVPYGDVTLKDAHKRQFKLNRNYLYGLGLYAGGISLTAYSKAVIYIANPEQIGSLVLNHEELSDSLHKYIQSSNFY